MGSPAGMDTVNRNDPSNFLRENVPVRDSVSDAGNLSIEQYDSRIKTQIAVPEPIRQREDPTCLASILGGLSARDIPREVFKPHPVQLVRYRSVINAPDA